MMVLGITGGIGSGKSTVSKIFQSLNCPVFNSDLEAKLILESDDLKPFLIESFGGDVFEENVLNRKKIAEIVFSDKSKLEHLNALIHPLVAEGFEKFLKKHPTGLIVKEAAILFETGSYLDNDANLLVVAPEKERVRRVMYRDNAEENEVQRRIQNQWPDEKKIPLADFVIDNSGEEFLIPQVLSVFQELKKRDSNA